MVRHLTLLVLSILWLNQSTAQVERFVKYGKQVRPGDTAYVLVIGPKNFPSNKSELLPYAGVRSVCMEGFNSIDLSPDSILQWMAEVINPRRIIFRDSDPSLISSDLSRNNRLGCIQFEKMETAPDYSFYNLLRNNNGLTTLRFQVADGEFPKDSLELLPSLERVELNSSSRYSRARGAVDMMLPGTKNTVIKVAYYGTLLVPPTPEVTASEPSVIVPVSAFNFPNINPPIKDVHINDTLYGIENSEIESTFKYQSGTSFTLQPNAFLNTDSSTYNGPVLLYYREFRDAVDVLLSGIPMGHTEGDSLHLFKSAGMFQLEATDTKGQKLLAKNDSVVTLKFATTDVAKDYNYYTLNSNGTWKQTRDSVPIVASKTKPKATEAVLQFYLLLDQAKNVQKDSTRFENRFESDQYLFTLRKDNINRSLDQSSRFYWYDKQVRFDRGIFKITHVKKLKDGTLLFKLTARVPTFPEQRYINRFMNVTLRYDGELDKNAFREMYCIKKGYYDLRTSGSSDQLNLRLKTSTSIIDLPCRAVYIDENGAVQNAEKTNRVLNRGLARSLAHQARIFNSKEKSRMRNIKNDIPGKDIKEAQKIAYKGCKRYMTEAESKLSFEEWINYALNNKPRWNYGEGYMDLNNSVASALINSGLGIRNLDTYIHNGSLEPILVQYQKEDTTRQMAGEFVAMVYQGLSSTYPCGFNSSTELRGYFYKNGNTVLVRFDNKGKMQVTSNADLLAARGKKVSQLAYNNEYEVTGLTSAQIKALIFKD